MLTDEDVRKLMVAREQYGTSTPAPQGAGCPVTATAQPQPAAGAAAESDGLERFSVTREELMSIVNDAVRNTKRRW